MTEPQPAHEVPGPGPIGIGLRTLRIVLLASALLSVLAFLAVVVLRIRYPFPLEWMESGLFAGAEQLANGRPVYTEPTLAYVPFQHMPMYYYVCAPFMRVLGISLFPMRLVSVLSTLGTVVAIFLIVRAVSRDAFAAALGACLYAASFEVTGGYGDLARADALNTFLLVSGFAWLLIDRSRRRGPFVAGVLFAFAILTKQSALFAIGPLVAWSLLVRRESGLLMAAGGALVLVGSTLWLERATGGWYTYFVYRIAASHAVVWAGIPYFWIRDVGRLGLAIAAGVAYFALTPHQERADARAQCAWWIGGMIFSSWLVRLFSGVAKNDMMPAVAAIAVAFGLGWSAVNPLLRAARGPLGRKIEGLVTLAFILQFMGLGYYPGRFVPTHADLVAGRALVERLRRAPGPVLVPFHSYLTYLAGKPDHFHDAAFGDVVLAKRGGEPAANLKRSFDEALRSRRWAAIVVDNANLWLARAASGYVRAGPVFDDPDVFWTVCGARTRPEILLVPRPGAPAAAQP